MQKIYVVQAELGAVKVGISANPVKRLAALRTGSAQVLKLVFAAACEGVSAERLERHVHSLLAARRKAGEWFDADAAMVVETIQTEAAKIGCLLQQIALVAPMENHPWQQRMREAGLSQRVLARLLGHAEITVSRQLRGHWESGVPQHVIAAVLAWELMTPDQRVEWIAAVEAELKRRERKPKTGAGE